MNTQSPRRLLRGVGSRNTVRLAVTGLPRCGKTVFTTSVVYHLLRGGQWPESLPFFGVAARGDLVAVEVSPLPDLPMFPFEESLGELTGAVPRWPEPTDRLCGLRISVRYRTRRRAARLVGPRTRVLHVDLVDYPGEWLLDLPLLTSSFAEWSDSAMNRAAQPDRAPMYAAWRGFVDRLDSDARSEAAALDRAAELFAAALREASSPASGLFRNEPAQVAGGRSRSGADSVPGFSPLPPPGEPAPSAGSLYAAMAARYDGYRKRVVAPFYRNHFRRFDAQIVLVDLLAALRHGEASFRDMSAAISAILGSLDYGRAGLPGWLRGGRTKHVVFAATKADHVSSNQHPNLRRLLQEMVARESNRIRFRGVDTSVTVLSSVRCTEDVVGDLHGQTLSMIRGLPAGRDAETALFPGEIPAHHPGPQDWREGRFRFLDFVPPGGNARGLRHIGLDEALQALIGSRLR